jgi:hypothetical protein
MHSSDTDVERKRPLRHRTPAIFHVNVVKLGRRIGGISNHNECSPLLSFLSDNNQRSNTMGVSQSWPTAPPASRQRGKIDHVHVAFQFSFWLGWNALRARSVMVGLPRVERHDLMRCSLSI